MNYNFRTAVYLLLLLLLNATIFAEQTLQPDSVTRSVPSLTVSGWGWLTVGRVENSQSQGRQLNVTNLPSDPNDMDFEKQWLVNYEAGLKLTKSIGKYSKARLHLMTSLNYPVLRNVANLSTAEPVIRKFSLTLLDAAILSTFCIKSGSDTIETEFGYLPVKYNPQSTNFGEYLFRSGTYPAYVVSGFELSDKVKLTGIHLAYRHHWQYAGSFKQDLFFTNDMDVYPVHDFSLSYLANYSTPKKLIDIGAGVNFAHLITVDERETIPAKSGLYPKGDPRVSFIDSVTNDTTLLTFRGTKATGRLTIDPKALYGRSFFGSQDLKIYGEIAVLGIKDYPGWYSNIRERMPVMFGFNIPTFGLLDILAIEGEYYEMPYWNSTEFIWKMSSPRPYTGSGAMTGYYSDWQKKTDDDWRWSIYASRKIANVIRVSAQFASDHLSRAPYTPTTPPKYTEVCTRTEEWYWMARVMYMF